jgi:hypothetical protein
VEDEVIWKSLSTLLVLVASASLIFGILKLADYQSTGQKNLPAKEE